MFNIDKKTAEEVKIEMNSQTENIAFLTELVEEFAKNYVPEEKAYDMAVAVDEAVTNIITHAYSHNPQGKIFVSIGKADGEVYICIEDFSNRFVPPIFVEKKKFTFDKLEEGGLGLYLMQEFMDELRFLYDNQEHKNILVMKKYLF
jgi:serine/threonine-protein kinase RsbW